MEPLVKVHQDATGSSKPGNGRQQVTDVGLEINRGGVDRGAGRGL
jgi:hypothetical protein